MGEGPGTDRQRSLAGSSPSHGVGHLMSQLPSVTLCKPYQENVVQTKYQSRKGAPGENDRYADFHRCRGLFHLDFYRTTHLRRRRAPILERRQEQTVLGIFRQTCHHTRSRPCP